MGLRVIGHFWWQARDYNVADGLVEVIGDVYWNCGDRLTGLCGGVVDLGNGRFRGVGNSNDQVGYRVIALGIGGRYGDRVNARFGWGTFEGTVLLVPGHARRDITFHGDGGFRIVHLDRNRSRLILWDGGIRAGENRRGSIHDVDTECSFGDISGGIGDADVNCRRPGGRRSTTNGSGRRIIGDAIWQATDLNAGHTDVILRRNLNRRDGFAQLQGLRIDLLNLRRVAVSDRDLGIDEVGRAIGVGDNDRDGVIFQRNIGARCGGDGALVINLYPRWGAIRQLEGGTGWCWQGFSGCCGSRVVEKRRRNGTNAALSHGCRTIGGLVASGRRQRLYGEGILRYRQAIAHARGRDRKQACGVGGGLLQVRVGDKTAGRKPATRIRRYRRAGVLGQFIASLVEPRDLITRVTDFVVLQARRGGLDGLTRSSEVGERVIRGDVKLQVARVQRKVDVAGVIQRTAPVRWPSGQGAGGG